MSSKYIYIHVYTWSGIPGIAGHVISQHKNDVTGEQRVWKEAHRRENSINWSLYLWSIYLAALKIHTHNLCVLYIPIRNAKSLDAAIDGQSVSNMSIVEPVPRRTHLPSACNTCSL